MGSLTKGLRIIFHSALNRPPQDWYAIFPDPVVGGAVLDRMVSSAIKLISTTGSSYRKEVMGNSTRSSAKTTAKAQK